MKKYLFLLLFIPFYGYAFIRYHIGKEVPFDEWFFILNKAIAWTAFTSIGLSVLKPKSFELINTDRRTTGMTGFSLAIFHSISVLLLFNSAHFEKMYTGDQLNFLGWMAIIIGIVSLLIFSFLFIAALKKLPKEHQIFRFGKVGFLLVMFHPLVIGISGWFSPESWPFYLPPITLLAVLSALTFLLFRLIYHKKE
jgi:DMSO/TMAO reductase YedYZ heme-binding membrane subunit